MAAILALTTEVKDMRSEATTKKDLRELQDEMRKETRSLINDAVAPLKSEIKCFATELSSMKSDLNREVKLTVATAIDEVKDELHTVRERLSAFESGGGCGA